MLGAANIVWSIAITRQVAGIEKPSGDAGGKEFAVPGAMVFSRHGTGVMAFEDFFDAPPDGLEGLPVAPGREGISVGSVAVVPVGIPATALDSLDQFWADPIPLARQRVVGVRYVVVFNVFEVYRNIWRRRRRGRKIFQHHIPHTLPQQLEATDV